MIERFLMTTMDMEHMYRNPRSSGAAFQGKYKGVACGCNLIGIKVLDRNGNGEKESVIRSLDWIQKTETAIRYES